MRYEQLLKRRMTGDYASPQVQITTLVYRLKQLGFCSRASRLRPVLSDLDHMIDWGLWGEKELLEQTKSYIEALAWVAIPGMKAKDIKLSYVFSGKPVPVYLLCMRELLVQYLAGNSYTGDPLAVQAAQYASLVDNKFAFVPDSLLLQNLQAAAGEAQYSFPEFPLLEALPMTASSEEIDKKCHMSVFDFYQAYVDRALYYQDWCQFKDRLRTWKSLPLVEGKGWDKALGEVDSSFHDNLSARFWLHGHINKLWKGLYYRFRCQTSRCGTSDACRECDTSKEDALEFLQWECMRPADSLGAKVIS